MYLDDVVVAGILILVLTCIFLGGVTWYVRKHIIQDSKAEEHNG